MIIPQAIFSRASLQPLLTIWEQLERAVAAAYPPPRAHDVRGEFAALANAWSTLAMGNNDTLDALYKKKALRQSHEDACIKRVQETYNNFIQYYNDQRNTNAIALGGLSTAAFDAIVPHPGTPTGATDIMEHALAFARFNCQYWTSATAFLHYARNALNLNDSQKTLGAIAQGIEDTYFVPLNARASMQRLELLVIGGTAADLQVAREELAQPYINGTYSCAKFFTVPMAVHRQHTMEAQLQTAFAQAVFHARSNKELAEISILDLGL